MATDESETLTNGETTETAASQPKRYLPLTLADAGWLTEATAPDVSLPALLHTLDTVESSAKMATAAVFYCSGLILIYARDHEDEWSAYTRQMQPPISVEGKQPVGGIEAEIGEMMLRRDYDYDDLGPAAKRGRRLSYARRAEYMADAIAKLDITTDTHFQIVAQAVEQGWKAVEKEVATRRIENNRKSSAQQGVASRKANKEAREAEAKAKEEAEAEAERVRQQAIIEEDRKAREATKAAKRRVAKAAALSGDPVALEEPEAQPKGTPEGEASEGTTTEGEASPEADTTTTAPDIITPNREASTAEAQEPEALTTETPISLIRDRLAEAKQNTTRFYHTVHEIVKAEGIEPDRGDETALKFWPTSFAVQIVAEGEVFRFTCFDDDALIDALVALIEEHRYIARQDADAA